MKYFLGIDPGLADVGFGIIESDGREIKLIDYGVIKTKPTSSFSERLQIIKDDLTEILKSYKFIAVGVEELFFVKNVTNGIKVAHARGVIIQTLNEFKIPLFEMTPKEVKNNICGYGGADKLQVQEMLKRIFNLEKIPKPDDAADALAIAIITSRTYKE